jgi:hypothetical protein
MPVVEALQARHQPAAGDGGLGRDPDLAPGLGDPPGGAADALERGGQLRQEVAAAAGQLDPVRPAAEQGLRPGAAPAASRAG